MGVNKFDKLWIVMLCFMYRKQRPTTIGEKMTSNITPYITVTVAAEVFKVPEKTIRSWISEGKLRGHETGSRGIKLHIDDVYDVCKELGL